MIIAGMNFSAEGRLPRMRFWREWLGSFILFVLVFGALYVVMEQAKDDSGRLTFIQILAITGMIIAVIVNTWVQTCVAIRRLHDRGRTGWWYLIVLLPYVGGFWFVVECGLMKGTVGSNRFGPDPFSPRAEATGDVFEAR